MNSLRFQVSLFGDFSKITPNEETIKNCITHFFPLGLLPTGNSLELNQETNLLEARLGLQSMRDGLTVNFLSDRIDIFALPLPGTSTPAIGLMGFIHETYKIVENMYKSFSPVVSRVGFVHEATFNPFSKEKLESIRNIFFTEKVNLFPNKEVTEWNIRHCNNIQFEGIVDQAVHVIHTISRVKVHATNQKKYETIHLGIDINTNPETGIQNNPDAIIDFLTQALMIEIEIENKISDLIHE